MEESEAPKQRSITVPTRWLRVAAVVVAAAAVAVVAVVVSHGAAAAAPAPGCHGGTPTLTEQGQASASGTPSVLDFDADIAVNASSAAAALSQDNTVTAAVVSALESNGVAKKDIATTNLSVNPNYSYVHGQSVISGYGVDNSLSVKIRHLLTAGTVIDAAASAGGNALSIDSLQFALSDTQALQDQARHEAVTQAISHARSMAAAAGQRLGSLCQLTDDSNQSTVPTPIALPAGGFNAAAASSVPLEPGTQRASAQITIVYALEERTTG
jgi:uncharacterized protein YggE